MTTFADLYEKYEKEAKDNELGNVEPGVYTLEVTSAKHDAAKQYIMPVFRIVDGPYAGKKIGAGVLSYSEKAVGIFLQKLAGFGLGKEFFSAAGVNSIAEAAAAAAPALKGRVVKVPLGVQKDGQYAGRNELPIRGIELLSAPDAVGSVAPAAAAPPPPPAQNVVPIPAAATPDGSDNNVEPRF